MASAVAALSPIVASAAAIVVNSCSCSTSTSNGVKQVQGLSVPNGVKQVPGLSLRSGNNNFSSSSSNHSVGVGVRVAVGNGKKKVSSSNHLHFVGGSGKKRVVMMAGGNGKKRVVMMEKNDSEKYYAGLSAVALAAAMVIPEMAEGAAPGVSPSLKNFLLSIASGSVVLGAIGVAVVGVSSFDPVKRN